MGFNVPIADIARRSFAAGHFERCTAFSPACPGRRSHCRLQRGLTMPRLVGNEAPLYAGRPRGRQPCRPPRLLRNKSLTTFSGVRIRYIQIGTHKTGQVDPSVPARRGKSISRRTGCRSPVAAKMPRDITTSRKRCLPERARSRTRRRTGGRGRVDEETMIWRSCIFT